MGYQVQLIIAGHYSNPGQRSIKIILFGEGNICMKLVFAFKKLAGFSKCHHPMEKFDGENCHLKIFDTIFFWFQNWNKDFFLAELVTSLGK